MRRGVRRWGPLVAAVVSGVLASGVVPASAPPTEFSAERAMEHLKIIAKEPRLLSSAGPALMYSGLAQCTMLSYVYLEQPARGPYYWMRTMMGVPPVLQSVTAVPVW